MFLDTSGLLCYHSRDEPEHAEAHRLFKGQRRHLTHSYVLAEFVALAQARKIPRETVLRFSSALLAHPRLEVVWVDRGLHEQALDLLGQCLDKAYSLCDAVSFVLMKRQGIQETLTTDRHFEQEGFTPRRGRRRVTWPGTPGGAFPGPAVFGRQSCSTSRSGRSRTRRSRPRWTNGFGVVALRPTRGHRLPEATRRSVVSRNRATKVRAAAADKPRKDERTPISPSSLDVRSPIE